MACSIAPLKEPGECKPTKIVRSFLFRVSDGKIGKDGNLVLKRRGTYGHRGKDGPKYFGREIIMYEYE